MGSSTSSVPTMKFALISHVLPPSWSGQAMVIYRLLRDLDPDEYCLISRQDYDTASSSDCYSNRLPGRYYALPEAFRIKRGRHSRLQVWRRRLNVLRLISLSVYLARIVRREKCGAVVACTGALLDPPAGYLASRLAGVPFYAYIFDYYSHQWTHPMASFVAQRLEPLVLRGAAGIIVPNEFLGEDLRCRYGVTATVIHNPCDISQYEAVPDSAHAPKRDEIKIVYTGAVYEAQRDACRNLLAAIELLQKPNAKLHVYSAQSPAELDEMGIRGPIVYHEHQALSTMPSVQRQADILFLPLAFTSPYPEIIRTSAPGKTGEYLAARRPILVHAPADSFLAWYFREFECGLVVDEGDPKKLARALERILTDSALRQRLCARAWERAKCDFSISTAQSRFSLLMKVRLPGGQGTRPFGSERQS